MCVLEKSSRHIRNLEFFIFLVLVPHQIPLERKIARGQERGGWMPDTRHLDTLLCINPSCTQGERSVISNLEIQKHAAMGYTICIKLWTLGVSRVGSEAKWLRTRGYLLCLCTVITIWSSIYVSPQCLSRNQGKMFHIKTANGEKEMLHTHAQNPVSSLDLKPLQWWGVHLHLDKVILTRRRIDPMEAIAPSTLQAQCDIHRNQGIYYIERTNRGGLTS